jgi:protein-tyrosine phosphatase
MLNFFRKNILPDSYAVLGLDFHSHLLPGLDDGAQTIEDTLSLVRQMQEMGFSRIVTTPHIYRELYPNTRDRILEKLDEVRAALRENHIEIELGAAAEYFLDEHFESLLNAKEPLLCVFDRCVLVETSFLAPHPQLEEYLFSMRMKGYTPILAHPERYAFLHHDFDQYERLLDMGCRFQVNLLSLTELYGRPVQKTAEKLLAQEMIDYFCTDLHHQAHADNLRGALKHKNVGKAINYFKDRLSGKEA